MSEFDFDKLVDEVMSIETIDKNKIQIWGGKIKVNEIRNLIDEIKALDMPFAIIECVHEINFIKTKDIKIENTNLLERIRLFGPEGDLDIRRINNNLFTWRFIGLPKNKKIFEEKYNGISFWEKNPETQLFYKEDKARLWGTQLQKNNQWYDPSVAKAKLKYPIDDASKEVFLEYAVLIENGNPAFIQFLRLKGGDSDE